MKRFVQFARFLLVATALVALLPLARAVLDWVEVSRMVAGPAVSPSARGFDWVLWQERDGLITARYVFPGSPAARTGLREGDQFYLLDGQQYFNAADLKRVVEGIPPGSTRTYHLLRDGKSVPVDVQFTHYPTFLYPLSGTLWQFAIWGFALGAFFHVLGLIIIGPISPRSRNARYSLLLILVSSLWMFGTLGRLLLFELFGPPFRPGGGYGRIQEALTFLSLVGWIGFPALLLHKLQGDLQPILSSRFGRWRLLVYLPAAVLGLAALATTLRGSLGPLTLDGLVAPILFYACCYIAAAALLVLLLHLLGREAAPDLVGPWSTVGSALTFAAAVFFALSVLGVVPLFGAVTDTMAGWLIVSAQLLSVAPVVLVSHAAIRYGKVDLVLSRALTYLTVLGLIFFAFVLGFSVIDGFVARVGGPRYVIAGLYVVVLLLVFERLGRRIRLSAASLFTSERRRVRQALGRHQEHMRAVLDYETLAHATVHTVAAAFTPRSAALYLRPDEEAADWVSATVHPEPPYLTERIVSRLWPEMEKDGNVWARNPELNESRISEGVSRLLVNHGAALVVPIVGEGPCGLLILGVKRQRRAVYNLEDVDLLRALGAQLALAAERLNLIEREKALVRESAEAQLLALRAQINPHFLFNALNTIISLIEERPGDAERTVEHLAAIFRHILQTGSRPFVTLEEELSLVTHYLSIERARFGSRLEVEQVVPEALWGYPVPAFAVQTLAENAVKHGLASRRLGGRIRIACRRVDAAHVEIVVADTGVGIPALFEAGPEAAPDDFFGIGLHNVSARLEKLYGRPGLLRLHSTPEAGTTARLLLPHAATDPAAAFATPAAGDGA